MRGKGKRIESIPKTRKPKCKVEDCHKESLRVGYCGKHHIQRWRTGNPVVIKQAKKCCMCDEKHHAKGYCENHYKMYRLKDNPCIVLGCENHMKIKGMCEKHYRREYRAAGGR